MSQVSKDIQKMLVKKMKQNALAKEKSVSARVDMGVEAFFTEWLCDFQKEFAACKSDIDRQNVINLSAGEAGAVIARIDNNASFTLIWLDDQITLSKMKIEGIRIDWTDKGKKSQGQNHTLIDSSSVLMREFGI